MTFFKKNQPLSNITQQYDCLNNDVEYIENATQLLKKNTTQIINNNFFFCMCLLNIIHFTIISLWFVLDFLWPSLYEKSHYVTKILYATMCFYSVGILIITILLIKTITVRELLTLLSHFIHINRVLVGYFINYNLITSEKRNVQLLKMSFIIVMLIISEILFNIGLTYLNLDDTVTVQYILFLVIQVLLIYGTQFVV